MSSKEKWYLKHKEECKKRCREYYHKNKIQIKRRQKEYLADYYQYNKERILAQQKIRLRAKYHNNPQFRLSVILRSRLTSALKYQNAKKANRTCELLGCSFKEAWQHIENTFANGMSWTNHGKWEVDHIIPVASFDLSDPKEQAKAFHFSNLQALWKEDNRSKGGTK